MAVALVLYSVMLLYLFAWAFFTTFKSNPEFRLNKIWLPQNWVWNYSFVYENFYVHVTTNLGRIKVYMPQQILNSLLYAIGCALANTIVPFATSYMCAKFRYKFSDIINYDFT